MKTTTINKATNTTFLKEWTTADFKTAERAILTHFMKNKYLHITDHETPAKPLIIYTLAQFDKVAGLAYTSTGDLDGISCVVLNDCWKFLFLSRTVSIQKRV